MRAKTKATSAHTKTVTAVVDNMTIRLFFINRQKLGVDKMLMILFQLGGLGIEYGWEYICPVVFTLPKSRITMGMKTRIDVTVRMRY